MYQNIKSFYRSILPKLTEEEWVALEECLTVKQVKKGEFVIKQGEICNHVSFINKGFVRFFMLVDGKEISTGFMMDGQYISAYESFLTRQPSNENIDALQNTELLQLSYTDMQRIYEAYPVYHIFARKVAEHLFIQISQRTTALQLLSPEQRYQNMIEKGSLLPQQIPQYMLASYIGVTPEHLSRIRKKMAQKGY